MSKQEDPRLGGGLSDQDKHSRDGSDGHSAAEQALALKPDGPELEP